MCKKKNEVSSFKIKKDTHGLLWFELKRQARLSIASPLLGAGIKAKCSIFDRIVFLFSGIFTYYRLYPKARCDLGQRKSVYLSSFCSSSLFSREGSWELAARKWRISFHLISVVANMTGFLGEYQLAERVPTEKFQKNPLKPTTIFFKAGSQAQRGWGTLAWGFYLLVILH